MHHNCPTEHRYIQTNVYVGNIYLLKKCPLLNDCPPCPFILPASLHEILLTKLSSMGVNKSFWLWCQSFLTNRTQQVKFLDVLSRVETVPAGVLQGAVISPMLFNIYINDMEDCIPNELPTTTCKYADDCSQYELVSTEPNSRMQEVVNFLEDWATQNKMS